MNFRSFIGACLAVIGMNWVAACGTVATSPKSAPMKTTEMEVDWRKDGIQKALEEAKSSGRPLLVYWGAVWCPPCNQLKAKAFHDPKFVAATRPFIAVYLDGDSDEAQIWGEHFQASGYPTLLVLNPDAQEVQRLVTSDSVEDLIAELNHTREDLSSCDDLLAKAANAKSSGDLPAQTWERLAAREWTNDERWRDRGGELAERLAALAKVFPKDLKAAHERVILQSIIARIGSLKDKATVPEPQRQEWRTHLEQLLDHPDEVQTQVGLLSDESVTFVKGLFPQAGRDPARDAFIARYLDAFRAYRRTEGLSTEHRLLSLEPFASLCRRADPLYPDLKPGDAESLKHDVDQQLSQADTPEKLVSALENVADVYLAIGLTDEAKKIVIEKMDRLSAKNEMMSIVAELESKQGHQGEALRWRERAYRQATGGSTRLQWGVGYILQLTANEPKSVGKIEAETKILLGDSLKRTDVFSGRSWRSLVRLSEGLQNWKKKQKIQLASTKLLPEGAGCGSTASNSDSRVRCEDFIKEMKSL